MPPGLRNILAKFPGHPRFLTSKRKARGPPTTHHPHKVLPRQVVFLGGGVVRIVGSYGKVKIRTTHSFALAMLIVDFVGVVCEFHAVFFVPERWLFFSTRKSLRSRF